MRSTSVIALLALLSACGLQIDADEDGAYGEEDCKAINATVHPDSAEIYDGGRDDGCVGLTKYGNDAADLRQALSKSHFRRDLSTRNDLWLFERPGLAQRLQNIEPKMDVEGSSP
jgi:sigma54-dependent transcription regulator